MTERVIKSPARAHIIKYSPSRNHKNTPSNDSSSLKRRYSSLQEDSDTNEPAATLSRSSTFASDIQTDSNNTQWTTTHWKKLEDWYIQDNNDGAPVIKELWTLDHILWRSQCLDTSVKFHQGLLPSERKKEKRRKLSGDNSSSTTSNASTSSSNTDSSTLSFKRPVTPAARVSSSQPTTPVRKTPVRTTPVRTTPTRTATTPVRRIPSYTSSVSFD
ncbi:unnamed protein product [Mucor hiemalis]